MGITARLRAKELENIRFSPFFEGRRGGHLLCGTPAQGHRMVLDSLSWPSFSPSRFKPRANIDGMTGQPQ